MLVVQWAVLGNRQALAGRGDFRSRLEAADGCGRIIKPAAQLLGFGLCRFQQFEPKLFALVDRRDSNRHPFGFGRIL